MNPRPRWTAMAAVLLSAALPGLARAQVPHRTLGAPRAVLADPFSSVAGLRELNDGRLLVSDATEQALWLVDLLTGTKEQRGRQGQGPGEYEMPGDLFAVHGDSTLMVDRLNQRFTLVLPDGNLGTSTIPLRHPNGFPIFPRGVDGAGRIYFDLAGIMMPGLEASAVSGVAPLMRWDPASGAKRLNGIASLSLTRT